MSKPTVVPFERPWKKDLVECLRERLAEAERGEIASFTFAMEYADGASNRDAFLDDGASVYKLIGIVEMLKQGIVEILVSS